MILIIVPIIVLIITDDDEVRMMLKMMTVMMGELLEDDANDDSHKNHDRKVTGGRCTLYSDIFSIDTKTKWRHSLKKREFTFENLTGDRAAPGDGSGSGWLCAWLKFLTAIRSSGA